MTYEELLEKARETYESEDTPHVVKAWLLANIIYPADESKDDRIRKMLHAYIHDFGVPKEYFEDIEKSDVLTWLEKQGKKETEMIEKACKWLRNNLRNYVVVDPDGVACLGHWENDFRNAMKGGEQ